MFTSAQYITPKKKSKTDASCLIRGNVSHGQIFECDADYTLEERDINKVTHYTGLEDKWKV